MNVIPLVDPSGQVRAWMCSTCERIFASREAILADSCCACKTCGRQAPAHNWCCEDCGETEHGRLAADFAAVNKLREESLGKSADKEAALLLAEEISRISEEVFCAGWLVGIEYDLWDRMHGRGIDPDSLLGQDPMARLKYLHEKARGWWHWPTGSKTNLFVTTEEWAKIFGGEKKCC